MQLFIDCDHHGIDLKNAIIAHFKEQNIFITDLALGIEKPYPLVASNMAQQVLATSGSRGILICKTGIGMSIIANKYAGIYANSCSSATECIAFREVNNGNVLCLGTMLLTEKAAFNICKLFIGTDFDPKNSSRIELIEAVFPIQSTQQQTLSQE